MRLLPLIIILILKASITNGQELIFEGNSVDTIEVISHLSAYKFDDEGTTEGKVEILTITKKENKKEYQISEYRIENFSYSSKSDKEEVRKKRKNRFKGKAINNAKLNELLKALQKSKSGNVSFENLSKDEFKKFVNKKRIKKVAKKNDWFWQFRLYYSTREENREFFEGCQSLDTFKIFLKENYQIEENSGYIMVTDFASVIEIHIKCKKKNYRFQGKYPNSLRQPWYDLTDWNSIDMKSISNLNINVTLYQLLPKKNLNRESISTQKLMDNYIIWYFRQRKMDL